MAGADFQKAFPELNGKEVDFLSLNARTESYPDGSIILREGQDPQEIMVITEGLVRVARSDGNGGYRDLTKPIGIGESLGEMSFVDGLGASAILIAEGEVTVEVVDRPLIERAIELDPTFCERFYHSILGTLINRLRRINDKIIPGEEG